MVTAEVLNDIKRSYSILNSLSDYESESKRQYSILKNIPAGETVFLKGDTCSFFAFILKGRARVYKTGESGREITLYRFQKGESCILTASCILSKNTFPAEALVEEVAFKKMDSRIAGFILNNSSGNSISATHREIA